MTLSDPSDPFVSALSASDMDGLRALEEDRDSLGPGLSKAELECAMGLRHLDRFFARARVHGYLIGETAGGLHQLGHDQPKEIAA